MTKRGLKLGHCHGLGCWWRVPHVSPAPELTRVLPRTAAFRVTGWIPGLALFGVLCISVRAQTNNLKAPSDLTQWSIEQLMQTPVSILRQEQQTLSQSPAAISVVTQDDIQRSGAMNIPEALRLVPGMDVAQLDSSQWAVSVRGFNDVFANKLLVLQDGRSIYTPLFSGVFWDVQGTMMEDIDRIEVIRGPGAALWGANAVNGVINIISKSSKDTQGLLLTGGGGLEDRGFAGVRYGGSIGSNVTWRVYGTYFDYDSTVLPNGNDANNDWQMARGGFRTDWDISDQSLLTVQGDAYGGWIHQTFGAFDAGNSPTFTDIVHDQMKVDGGNVLARWTRTFSEASDLKLQAYYDRTDRDAAIFNESRDTFDLDLEHRFDIGDRNHVGWGMEYRITSDHERNNPTIAFNPTAQTLNLFSAFLQDEIELVPDHLNLTLGTKVEHNDYTGLEVQPGARLSWKPWLAGESPVGVSSQTFWASVARAVRTPSRAEESITLNQAHQVAPGVFVPVTIVGNSGFESERLLAYEAGYRVQPVERLSLDLALFYNQYDDLRSQDPIGPTEFTVANNLFGDAYGAEVSGTWKVADWWRLQPSYSFLEMQVYARRDRAGFVDAASVGLLEGASPENQFSLRSSMDFLSRRVMFDSMLRYVDALPAHQISGYVELDLRLAWRPTDRLEFAIVGQNLIHDHHAEFSPSFIETQSTEIPRTVFAKVTWRF